jgi:hypothetical protein
MITFQLKRILIKISNFLAWPLRESKKGLLLKFDFLHLIKIVKRNFSTSKNLLTFPDPDINGIIFVGNVKKNKWAFYTVFSLHSY